MNFQSPDNPKPRLPAHSCQQGEARGRVRERAWQWGLPGLAWGKELHVSPQPQAEARSEACVGGRKVTGLARVCAHAHAAATGVPAMAAQFSFL